MKNAQEDGTNQSRVLTCVYCGHEYPQDTPSWGNQVLTDHIKVCPKHPMRKAEADIEMLRKALVKFIGAETKEELLKMKKEIAIVDNVKYRNAVLNAVEALLKLISEEQ